MFAVFWEKDEFYYLDGEKVMEQPEVYDTFEEAFERVGFLQREEDAPGAHMVDYT